MAWAQRELWPAGASWWLSSGLAPRPRPAAPFPAPGRVGNGVPLSPDPSRVGKRGFPIPRFSRRKPRGTGPEHTQPRVSCQRPRRQHAAPTQGPRQQAHQREGTCSVLLRVTSINRNGLRVCSAASINALTGSIRLLFRVREREHAAVIAPAASDPRVGHSVAVGACGRRRRARQAPAAGSAVPRRVTGAGMERRSASAIRFS